MIELILILIILSTITSMSMVYQSKTKGQEDERFKDEVVTKYLYASAILFGALGILISIYAFNYQKDNKKLISFSLIMTVVHLLIVLLLM